MLSLGPGVGSGESAELSVGGCGVTRRRLPRLAGASQTAYTGGEGLFSWTHLSRWSVPSFFLKNLTPQGAQHEYGSSARAGAHPSRGTILYARRTRRWPILRSVGCQP